MANLSAQTFSQSWSSARQFLLADPKAVRLVKFLISIDVIFLVVHVFKYVFKSGFIDLFGYWIYRNLTLTNDWAFPEIFNYLKYLVIIYLLYRVFAVVKQSVYLAWAFVYTVALLDDSLEIHEALGAYFGSLLSGATLFGAELQAAEGFRIQDLGELLVYLLYGGVFVVALGAGFLWSQSLHRRIGTGFLLLLASLAFFAAAVDLLGRLVPVFGVFGTVEDFGEMVVLSLTVGYAYFVYLRYGPQLSQR